MAYTPTESFWKHRRVFVTGCTGILGSWLTMRLVELGADVVGLIRDQVPHSNLNWSGFQTRINIVHGDVCDYDVLERALAEYEIEVVFHLAAQTIVPIANRVPRPTFETNVRGTWNLLEACRHNPTVERVVIASSDKAYGEQPVLPYTEEQPLLARYPYDVSKAAADMIAQSYYHTFGLPVAITRLGNIYGGGDLNWNRIVPGTIRSAYYGERPIIRSDGSPKRDYIYVKDAVNAYITLAEHLHREEVQGQVFNFAPEYPISVLDLTYLILERMGRADLEPLVLSTATGEIQNQYLSAEKAHRVLGWRPHYSLEEGLDETIAWYRAFFEQVEG